MKKIGMGILLGLATVGALQADTIYQDSAMGYKADWNEAFWGGAAPTNGNDYVNNIVGGQTRTTHASNGSVFAGDSLTLMASGSYLTLKSKNDVAVDMVMYGGTRIENGGGGYSTTMTGTLSTMGSGAISFGAGEAGRSITFTGVMTIGSGIDTINIDMAGADRDSHVTVDNAGNTFGGTWNVTAGLLQGVTAGSFGDSSFTIADGGILDFEYNFSNEAGDLTMNGVLDLDQDLTFGSASIAGVTIDAGTYTIAQLTAIDGITDASFDDLAATGTITVIPEPATIGMLGLGAAVTVLLRKRQR